MKEISLIRRVLFSIICFALLFISLECGGKTASADLPQDISGIYIGMSKTDMQRRLEKIADFERDERKNQQVWKMKDTSRFSHIAVGFDKEDKIRYITAFVDKESVKEKISFTEVGDISTAKQEILAPHHRYIWEVPASGGKPAYTVNIYGDNPDFVTIFSLAKIYTPDELKESGEEEESE